MKRCCPIESGRSILIVVLCCLSHTLLKSKIHICICVYKKEKKNILKSFPNSTGLQVYACLITPYPCPPPPKKKKQVSFLKPLSFALFCFTRKVLVLTSKGEMRQGFDLKDQTFSSLPALNPWNQA